MRTVTIKHVVVAIEAMLEDVEVVSESGTMKTAPFDAWAAKIWLIQIHDAIAALQRT